ncbi:hypothetical protein HKBW3S06_01532, partial [Candidatus Hakubella thermalkaliphila]
MKRSYQPGGTKDYETFMPHGAQRNMKIKMHFQRKIRMHFQQKKNFLWTIRGAFFVLLFLLVSCTGIPTQEEAPGPQETSTQEDPPSEEQLAPGRGEETAEVPGQEPGQVETEEDLKAMDEWCPSWSPDGSRII